MTPVMHAVARFTPYGNSGKILELLIARGADLERAAPVSIVCFKVVMWNQFSVVL
jgi:hypothetical protein